jgi:hypothetical protein
LHAEKFLGYNWKVLHAEKYRKNFSGICTPKKCDEILPELAHENLIILPEFSRQKSGDFTKIR